ncbi:MAG: T9SS type A sorting domain-containing protein [Bacteroidota bacterium]|nr:T9SS type A sorting domain-containing protein [Bacteroidota bacterium]
MVSGKFEQQSVCIYPHPATGIVYISSRSPIRQWSVINVAGIKVLTMAIGDLNTTGIPLQSLPRGMYLIEIKTEAGDERQSLLKQ